MLLGVAKVLRLQHEACGVANADERGQALAGHRAVGLQPRAAVGHGQGFPVDNLVDGRLVVRDKEAALGDVPHQGRRGEGRSFRLGLGPQGLRGRNLRQAAHGGPQGLFERAGRDNAIALLPPIESVLPAPGAEHHLGVVVEIFIDGNLNALDGQRQNLQPA